jgi:cell division septation protein DedD
VQILATRKEGDADALVRKLKSRGFGAYIKKVSDGDGAWYRVRVGSYGAFSQARAMADKCRSDLGLGQAFVSTE